ncbi:MAG: extracellular solute-binding protein [Byssovorax sp.]
MRSAAKRAAVVALLGAVILLFTFVFGKRSAVNRGAANATEVRLLRMFGSCSDEYASVTDLSRATGECGIIQVLTNRFNAENEQGIFVRTETVEWTGYYDHLSAMFATGNPPDVAVMHRSSLPGFTGRDLLLPLGAELQAAGIDLDDYVAAAREAVTVRGEVFALPFDLHALLWHVNLDLMAQAGLVDARGAAVLPRSPEELLAHAERMKRRTGRPYFAIPSQTDPMPTWTFETWVWQQGGEIISANRRKALLHTPQGARALELLAALHRGGHAGRGLDYAGAEQAFLGGEAAVIINGTWGVDHYDAEAKAGITALKRYGVYTPPTLFQQGAAWTDSHLWVLPRHKAPDLRKQKAAVTFLRYLHDHGGTWARTGHLPVRTSVLESEEFRALPHRAEYLDTARIARALPPIENQRAVQDAIVDELNATWLLGRSPARSLSAAQWRVDQILEGEAR